jgi:hypothetical protein
MIDFLFLLNEDAENLWKENKFLQQQRQQKNIIGFNLSIQIFTL